MKNCKYNFQNKVVMITGANSGIGADIARQFERNGADLILIDLNFDRQNGLRPTPHHSKSQKTLHVHADLRKAKEIDRIFRLVWKDFKNIDILVNNAGISPKHDGRSLHVDELPFEEWNDIISVNLTAPYLLTKNVLPYMKRSKWGRIINMASVAGRTRSTVAGSPYAASKAGLIGFTRQLAAEVGEYGITANCIAPGRIETAMIQTMDTSVNEKYLKRIPVNRLGTTADISNAALFLASEQSGFITGVTIDVNGGSFMG